MSKVKNINNVELVIKELLKWDINNTAFHIGILCCIAKESGFELKEERGYQNTSNERIRKIFGKKKLGKYYYDDKELTWLKEHSVLFFNQVYANIIGNGNVSSGHGWKYRGRGFIQLTGKNNYKVYSDKEYNLTENPDLLNDPIIAAKVVINFMERGFNRNKKFLLEQLQCDTDNVDDIIEVNKGILLAVNINSGGRRNLIDKSLIRAFNHAKKYKKQMIELYNEHVSSTKSK